MNDTQRLGTLPALRTAGNVYYKGYYLFIYLVIIRDDVIIGPADSVAGQPLHRSVFIQTN